MRDDNVFSVVFHAADADPCEHHGPYATLEEAKAQLGSAPGSIWTTAESVDRTDRHVIWVQ